MAGLLDDLLALILPFTPNILQALLAFIGAKIALNSVNWIFRKVISGLGIPQAYYRPVRQLIVALIYFFAAIFILTAIPGINQTILGLLSVGVAVLVSFGSTTTIGNAVAGIIIIVTRPIKEGDRIKVNNIMGDVVSTELLFVHIKTIKNEIISMPALQVLNSQVINYSVIEDLIIHVDIGLGYDTDLKKAEELMIQAARETNFIDKKKDPFLLVKDLADHKIVYEVNAYIDDPLHYVKIESQLRRNILSKFASAGIELVSPTKIDLRQTQGSIISKIAGMEKEKKEKEQKVEEAIKDTKKEIEERRKK